MKIIVVDMIESLQGFDVDDVRVPEKAVCGIGIVVGRRRLGRQQERIDYLIKGSSGVRSVDEHAYSKL
jgi:hypothetical protein